MIVRTLQHALWRSCMSVCVCLLKLGWGTGTRPASKDLVGADSRLYMKTENSKTRDQENPQDRSESLKSIVHA